jgi:hypothetical protein
VNAPLKSKRATTRLKSLAARRERAGALDARSARTVEALGVAAACVTGGWRVLDPYVSQETFDKGRPADKAPALMTNAKRVMMALPATHSIRRASCRQIARAAA